LIFGIFFSGMYFGVAVARKLPQHKVLDYIFILFIIVFMWPIVATVIVKDGW